MTSRLPIPPVVTERPLSRLERLGRKPWWPRLRLSERHLLLLLVDLLVINLALAATVWWLTDLVREPADFLYSYAKWFVTLTVLWLIVANLFNCYDLPRATTRQPNVALTWVALVLTALVYWLIPFLTPTLTQRALIPAHLALAAAGLALWRLFYAAVLAQPAFHRTALVVGAGPSGQALAQVLYSQEGQHFSHAHGVGYQLAGFVDGDPDRVGAEVAGVAVLGTPDQLVRLARTLHVDQVVVALEGDLPIALRMYEALLDCRELGIPVIPMATLYEQLTGRVFVSRAGHDIVTMTGEAAHPLTRLYGGIQTLVDLVAAVCGLVLVLILIPLIALANRLWSPGPLFYHQQRVGRGGRPFTVVKFRSMRVDAEEAGQAVWAGQEDARVTTIGRFLRRTHLDELPQVWNVLRREMSVIGPRPERPEFVGLLNRTIPFYRARHSVRPGITGWAQVHQDYGDSVEGAREKLEYDLYYIRHANPLLDLLILLRTFSKMFAFRGR